MTDRGRVLIVEDDPDLREIFTEVLRDEGWETHAARDGVEALEMLRDGVEPCVVVADLRMPRMDGWELAEHLRQSGRWTDTPFVVVAAHYRIQDEARHLGAGWWLQKPVSVERLIEVVGEACASGRAA